MNIDEKEDGPVDLGMHFPHSEGKGERPTMKAESVRAGVKIGTSRVLTATTGMTSIAGRGAVRARICRMANGKTLAFELGTMVAVKRGYAEPLPAGGVESGNVKTPAKVRAHNGAWRGESVHGMTTRSHDMLARTNMYDQGRVNGSVGPSRDGLGSVAATGGSF